MQICKEQIDKTAILMHAHAIIPDIRSSGELENILTTNYEWFSSSMEPWEVVRQISCKDIDTVGVLSFSVSNFTRTTINIPIKFPAFTFDKPKGWSISASNSEANSPAFIMRGKGDHLTFAIPQGITKILLIQQGDH